jgi:uncharacterized OsmC-like protein
MARRKLLVNLLKRKGVFEVERIGPRTGVVTSARSFITSDEPSHPGENKMDAATLRATQAPIKERYKSDPKTAMITLTARGSIENEGIACKVETGRALAVAGLHPGSGGSGLELCSGDMLLEALVACAGVTLKAVATAIDFRLSGGSVRAEGDLDFRGTLGVAKDAAVGFTDIRLYFDLGSDEPQERIDALTKLTERYCVVFQTLAKPPKIALTVKAGK